MPLTFIDRAVSIANLGVFLFHPVHHEALLTVFRTWSVRMLQLSLHDVASTSEYWSTFWHDFVT